MSKSIVSQISESQTKTLHRVGCHSEYVDAYVTGTANVKKVTAKSHANSKTHKSSILKASPVLPENQERRKLITKLDEATFAKMCRLFDWAHLIAKKEDSFTSFPLYAAIEKKHGVDMGESYMNEKACKVFIQAIGEEMAQELKNLFTQEPFYCSVLFNGSSDKSLLELEVISLRLIENGLSRMKLLGVTQPVSGSGENVYQATESRCKEYGLQLKESCIAGGADGAAVKFGSHAGVLTRITADVPWLVQVHCVAYRLELAPKDAFKGTYFEEIDDLMMQMYYMFKRSAKKWQELKATGDILQEHVLKLTRSHATRWVDHRRRSLKAIHADLPSLVTMLEDMASEKREDISSTDAAKYKGYVKIFKSCKLVLFLAFYQDVVDDLADLSTSLQYEHLPISAVKNNILSTLISLETKSNGQSQRTKKVLQQVTEANHWEYRGVKLNHCSTDMSELEKQANAVLDNILLTLNVNFAVSKFTYIQENKLGRQQLSHPYHPTKLIWHHLNRRILVQILKILTLICKLTIIVIKINS